MKLTTLCTLFLPAALAAQNPLWSLHGKGLLEAAGSSAAGLGDVDGDGVDDFIVGATQETPLKHQPGLVRAYSGKTGRVLFELRGRAAGDAFGQSVAGGGDVDKDGVPDFVVGATPIESTTKKGYARVYSGRTRKVLWELNGDSNGEWFGASVAMCGDLDKDGHGDFLVGAPLDDHTVTDAGVVRAYSGKTGKVLRTWNGIAKGDRFGYSVAGAGDVDRDTFPDVIIGAYLNDKSATNAGSAYVFSGKDGRRIMEFTGTAAQDGFGFSVAGAGDVDKDGWRDLLVGALWAGPAQSDNGSTVLYSGRTALPLKELRGDGPFDGMGTAVIGTGDMNGDGYLDFAGGAIQAFPPGRNGYVRVWSGKDYRELYTFRGAASGDWFGRALGVADVNKDGRPDLIVGASKATTGVARGGSAWVYSGNHIGLTTNTDQVSATAGGVQLLHLDARPIHANKLYFVLGTSGATTPGIPLGRITLPLTNDAYFFITLVSPNTPLLQLTLGKLDANGKRTAFFKLPRGLPKTIAGLTLHHSFVVIEGALDFQFASNPAILHIRN